MEVTQVDGGSMAVMPEYDIASAQPGGALGKDEFLKLLVTQLSYQDPFDPMDSRESIAQLAQFSSLEQMQNMNEGLDAMRQASGLIDGILLEGMAVSVELKNGMQYEGVIDAVRWENGELVLRIGEANVALSNVSALRLLVPEYTESAEEDDVEDDALDGMDG